MLGACDTATICESVFSTVFNENVISTLNIEIALNYSPICTICIKTEKELWNTYSCPCHVVLNGSYYNQYQETSQ